MENGEWCRRAQRLLMELYRERRSANPDLWDETRLEMRLLCGSCWAFDWHREMEIDYGAIDLEPTPSPPQQPPQ